MAPFFLYKQLSTYQSELESSPRYNEIEIN